MMDLQINDCVITKMYLHTLVPIQFLVLGFGNWKFKSIDYDKKDIFGYTVPYHAHSDFIQIGAELGIIGFVLYLGIFILSVFYLLLSLENSEFYSRNKMVFINDYCLTWSLFY